MIGSDSFTVFFACVNFEELAAIGFVPVQVFPVRLSTETQRHCIGRL
jgi:hypothetical protein